MSAPKAFMSYSWDDDQHKEWVAKWRRIFGVTASKRCSISGMPYLAINPG